MKKRERRPGSLPTARPGTGTKDSFPVGSAEDLLPPDPAHHSPLEGKNQKVGAKASFLEFLLVFRGIYAIVRCI